MINGHNLPVSEKLPQIIDSLQSCGGVILRAAPGAGKTMLVPAAVAGAVSGRVIVIEPRRIAAKSAAAGIAFFNGFTLGRECGFAVRGESCRSRDTRILAVTPGVFLNMLRNDPALSGIGAVVFDEFHERSAENDLAFAFTMECREVLRPELAAVLMSATMEVENLKTLTGLPVVDVPGREFPVEISYCGGGDSRQISAACARQVLFSLRDDAGDILVFLPGKREIERCREMLTGAVDKDKVSLLSLHGGLSLSEQSRVLAPAAGGVRKVILSTNVAESSLTVENVRVVIDSGWERRMRFAPGSGFSFLELVRISCASAGQRAGRAGRIAPGKAVRLWEVLDERNFKRERVPEILEADLCVVALWIASWGTPAEELALPDPVPPGAYQQALQTLQKLGLLDEACQLTEAGKTVSGMPVHPRLGRLLLTAEKLKRQKLGVDLAALLSDGEERHFGGECDLRSVVSDFRRHPERYGMAALTRRELSKWIAPDIQDDPGDDLEECGRLIASAFPEWIGKSRSRGGIHYQLSGGGAASLPGDSTMLNEEYLAVARLNSAVGRNSFITLAAPVSAELLEADFAGAVREEEYTFFDPDSDRGGTVAERKLGALVLSSRQLAPDCGNLSMAVLDEALRRHLPLPPANQTAAVQLLQRISFALDNGEEEFPDWRGEQFAVQLRKIIPPFIAGVRNFAALEKAPWLDIIKSSLDFNQLKTLDRFYPSHYTAPTGMSFPIDYSGETPTLSLPVSQLYGETVHPTVGSRRLPLRLELLSPARRPIQVTGDLPGFWSGTWSLVRSEMRSRYPKHEWPEDPASALPMRHSIRKK